MVEARGQFGTAEEGERSLVNADTRGLVKRWQNEKTRHML